MASVNKVILIGNLGADPEVRATAAGESVCNLRLATSEQWKDRESGETRETTEWHRVVLYRRLAEIAGNYLRKGSSVYIEGRLRTRRWQDRDGKERQTTEIEGQTLQMLGARQDAGREPARPAGPARSPGAPVATLPNPADGEIDEDDIPF